MLKGILNIHKIHIYFHQLIKLKYIDFKFQFSDTEYTTITANEISFNWIYNIFNVIVMALLYRDILKFTQFFPVVVILFC